MNEVTLLQNRSRKKCQLWHTAPLPALLDYEAPAWKLSTRNNIMILGKICLQCILPRLNSVRVNKITAHRCGNKWCSAAWRSPTKYQLLFVMLFAPGKEPLLPDLCLVQRLLWLGLLRASLIKLRAWLLKPRACLISRSCKCIQPAKGNSNLQHLLDMETNEHRGSGCVPEQPAQPLSLWKRGERRNTDKRTLKWFISSEFYYACLTATSLITSGLPPSPGCFIHPRSLLGEKRVRWDPN